MVYIKNIPTCELVKELANREGVARRTVDADESFGIAIDEKWVNFEPDFGFEAETGPAIILAIID